MSGQGTEIISQAQDQAMKLVDTARQQATSQISTQQQRAGRHPQYRCDGPARRQSRDAQSGRRAIADYVDMAASQVEQFANMLREQDLEQLMATTAQFARRRRSSSGPPSPWLRRDALHQELGAIRQRADELGRCWLVVRAAGRVWHELV